MYTASPAPGATTGPIDMPLIFGEFHFGAMGFCVKNDEICMKDDELLIVNDGFCISNDIYFTQDVGLLHPGLRSSSRFSLIIMNYLCTLRY